VDGYRDDRAALKKRNEELEDEVERLRAQLASKKGDAPPTALVTGAVDRPLPASSIAVGIVAVVGAAWMEAGPLVGVQITVLAILASVVLTLITRLLVVPAPHEVAVISGAGDAPFHLARKPHLRLPLLQTAQTLDLRARLVDLRIDAVYCKGGVPIRLRGYAIVGVDPDEPGVRHAVERFLDASGLERVAAQTIESAARELIAALTPEELSLDRMKAADHLRDAAQAELDALGLSLLDLGVEEVSDDVGYLDALSRKRIAEALREAELLDHDRSAP